MQQNYSHVEVVVAVDPDRACVEVARDLERGAHVTRADAGREAVLRAVGAFDRFLVRLELHELGHTPHATQATISQYPVLCFWSVSVFESVGWVEGKQNARETHTVSEILKKEGRWEG